MVMKSYGLIGYPLGHSFSKKYFTEKFQREGISDCQFEAFPIPAIEEFPQLLKDNPNLLGLSVTIPYKEQVLQYVDELSDEVAFIGATNSIKIKNGKLTAYNTDIVGFEQTFVRKLQPHHKRALILGSGGASKAVQYTLKKLGIDFLVVSRGAGKSGFISYEALTADVMREYTVIINSSPVGMYPNDNDYPNIPYELLTTQHYLYDLVYRPAETMFLQKGAAQGASTLNGEEMLVLQAEASWKIWNELI